MSVAAVLAPVFVLVAMIFVLLIWTGRSRVAALRSGEVKLKDIALGQQAWPERVTQIGNSYNNQMQLPLLFFVLVALALPLRQTDLLFVIMSWVFVVLRIVHAFIHTRSIYVPRRFSAFVAGVFVLMAMWAIFAVRILVVL